MPAGPRGDQRRTTAPGEPRLQQNEDRAQHGAEAAAAVEAMPEHRIVVCTPAEEESRELTARRRELDDPLVGCPRHARPLSVLAAAQRAAAERNR